MQIGVGLASCLVPKLESLKINKNDGKLVLAKVKIGEQPELAEKYEVMVLPTVLAVTNSKKTDKFVGFKNGANLSLIIYI